MESDVTQSAAFDNLLAWLEVNKKRLLIWGGVLAAAAAIAGVFIVGQKQREESASKALSEIRIATGASSLPSPETAAAFFDVARKYSGTKAAERASLQGAGTLFGIGKYSEAQKEFDRFQKEYPTSPWMPQALFGVAACLDAQKMSNEAERAYEDLRKRYPNDPAMDEAKLALGRLYEAQKPKEALALYEDVLKASPYGGMGSEAGMRKEDLLQKHPELVPKTNAPPIMTPAVGPNTSIRLGTNNTLTVSNLTQPKATTPAPAPALAPAPPPAPAAPPKTAAPAAKP